MSFGINFFPGSENMGEGPDQQGGLASGVPPWQQAIKFLSLRLPRFLGPGAIAPGALLAGPGAGGLPAGDVGPMPGIPGGQPAGGDLPPSPFSPSPGSGNPVEEIIRRLAQSKPQPMPQPPSPIPGPRFTPIDEPAPGMPAYLPGANETSRGGAPFYRDAPATDVAIPRSPAPVLPDPATPTLDYNGPGAQGGPPPIIKRPRPGLWQTY